MADRQGLPAATGDVPYELVNGDSTAGLLFICDHASNALPPGYGNLGLKPSEFSRHIAYDIGAAPVSRALAASLGAPAVLTRYSRLLIDCNRGKDDPTLIPRLSDGAVVPVNAGLDAAERRKRIAGFYEPYHAAIAAAIDEALAAGRPPMIVSIHSFTPLWRGRLRPWHAGVLWDADPRLARPLIEALAAESGIVVGDNEPYDGALANDTLFRHGTRGGLAHALIEIRQDLIADTKGADAWTERLSAILADLNQRSELHQVRHYDSRTGAVEPAASSENGPRLEFTPDTPIGGRVTAGALGTKPAQATARSKKD